jgi:hypothetical protein
MFHHQRKLMTLLAAPPSDKDRREWLRRDQRLKISWLVHELVNCAMAGTQSTISRS